MKSVFGMALCLFLFSQPCCSQDANKDKAAKKPEKPVVKKTVKILKDWHLRDELARNSLAAIGSAPIMGGRLRSSDRSFASLRARAKLFKLQNEETKKIVNAWIGKCPKDQQASLIKLFESAAFEKHLKDQALFGSKISHIRIDQGRVYVLAHSAAKVYLGKVLESVEKFMTAQKVAFSKGLKDPLKKYLEQRDMAWATKQRVYLKRIPK